MNKWKCSSIWMVICLGLILAIGLLAKAQDESFDKVNGNGFGLTNINATNISGVVSSNNLPGLIPSLSSSNGFGLTNLNVSTNTASNFSGTLAGDVTGPQGSTLLSTVVIAGTAQSITFDVKGRVVSGTGLTAPMIPALTGSNVPTGTVNASTNAINVTGSVGGSVALPAAQITGTISTANLPASIGGYNPTITQTNFIDGKLNTNTTGRKIFVWAPCKMTPAIVAGNAQYSLVITGVSTNTTSAPSLLTLLIPAQFGSVFGFVEVGGTFSLTNSSTGIGNTAAIVNGGQYFTF